jgi:hypothetical protein
LGDGLIADTQQIRNIIYTYVVVNGAKHWHLFWKNKHFSFETKVGKRHEDMT